MSVPQTHFCSKIYSPLILTLYSTLSSANAPPPPHPPRSAQQNSNNQILGRAVDDRRTICLLSSAFSNFSN